ncbi:MAG: toxin-antitoxin system HicB family antitoxin [Candidatus Sericytochromatia bacterium]|uniref:Toxin-antitoxin system HicB family antitoxin n=1 Tax=Candidatus Tanganyikabacteria bacterium TaxID=2961651 RepID=A0A937X0Y9_9BACT|nr:toxin-antitoxin system HicB family antitoxin [Candidatus Tanganyikabacteria bacterium]
MERIRVAIDVPRDLRRKIRLAAAQREMSLNEYVREALAKQVAEDLVEALQAVEDPVLSDLWDNQHDDVYDTL